MQPPVGASSGQPSNLEVVAPPLPQADITREKASFDKSVTVIKGQSANIDSKTWWLVR